MIRAAASTQTFGGYTVSMNQTKKTDSSNRGTRFEERVFLAITKLEQKGFAKRITLHDQVADRDGNTRTVDLTFILQVLFVEILVSVECKSRGRHLSLGEVDQIKTFKQELPERNIFWLVSEGGIGKNAAKALKKAGIAFYQIKDFEDIIDEICSRYDRVEWLRAHTRMLSGMCPSAHAAAQYALSRAEEKLDRLFTNLLGLTVEDDAAEQIIGRERRKSD